MDYFLVFVSRESVDAKKEKRGFVNDLHYKGPFT